MGWDNVTLSLDKFSNRVNGGKNRGENRVGLHIIISFFPFPSYLNELGLEGESHLKGSFGSEQNRAIKNRSGEELAIFSIPALRGKNRSAPQSNESFGGEDIKS